MNWTNKTPTVAGWYWYREVILSVLGLPIPPGKIIIRKVADWPGGGLCVHAPEASAHFDGVTTPDNLDGEWYGPLQPPE